MRRGRLLYVAPAALSPKVQLHNQTVAAAGHNSTATARYRLLSNGNVVDQNATILENWLISGTVPNSAYEVRGTLLSGSVTGTFGAWQNVSAAPSWSCTVSSPGSVSGQFKVEMRDAATLAVLVSAVINLSADFGS